MISGNVTTRRRGRVARASSSRAIGKRVTRRPLPVAAVPCAAGRLDGDRAARRRAVMIAWPMPTDPKAAYQGRGDQRRRTAWSSTQRQGARGTDRARRCAAHRCSASSSRGRQGDGRGRDRRSAASHRDVAVGARAPRSFDARPARVRSACKQTAIYARTRRSRTPERARHAARSATCSPAAIRTRCSTAEFAGLRELAPRRGARIAHEYLSAGRGDHRDARGAAGKKRGKELVARRDGPRSRASAAIRPIRRRLIACCRAERGSHAPRMRTRTLRERPAGRAAAARSVPTVDIRLVFARRHRRRAGREARRRADRGVRARRRPALPQRPAPVRRGRRRAGRRRRDRHDDVLVAWRRHAPRLPARRPSPLGARGLLRRQ